MIKISLICVVKNEQKFITKLLSSIEETCPAWLDYELIIIDDHSIDKTVELIRGCEKNSRISLYRNPLHGKVGATGYGISLAKYPWIKFLDGDDWVDFSGLSPNDFDNCSAFYHDFIEFRDGQNTPRICSLQLQKDPQKFMSRLRTIPKAMFFVKREAFEAYLPIPKRITFEDIWINFIVVLSAQPIKKVNKKLYFYRQHESNNYGSNSTFNKEKKERMVKRFQINLPVLRSIAPNFEFSPALELYFSSLRQPTLRNMISLIRYPHFLLKSIYYMLKTS